MTAALATKLTIAAIIISLGLIIGYGILKTYERGAITMGVVK